MRRCMGNVSAHLNCLMASASSAQCLYFPSSLCCSVVVSVVCVCNFQIKYCMQGRIQKPLQSVDFGLGCRLLLLLFLLHLRPKSEQSTGVCKVTHNSTLGCQLCGVCMHCQGWSEGISFSWVPLGARALQRFLERKLCHTACAPDWRRQNKLVSPIL